MFSFEIFPHKQHEDSTSVMKWKIRILEVRFTILAMDSCVSRASMRSWVLDLTNSFSWEVKRKQIWSVTMH